MSQNMDAVSQNGNDGDHYLLSKKYWVKKTDREWQNGEYTIRAVHTSIGLRYQCWHKSAMFKCETKPEDARTVCQSHFTTISSK